MMTKNKTAAKKTEDQSVVYKVPAAFVLMIVVIYSFWKLGGYYSTVEGFTALYPMFCVQRYVFLALTAAELVLCVLLKNGLARTICRYWLAAWFGPAVFTVLAAVLYFAVFPHRLDLSGSWLAAAYGGEMDAQTLRRELGVSNLSYMLETGLFAVTLAPVINMFAALGEEAGWRGYMMPHLKKQLGLLNGRLLGGVIWGVWHWPLMLLVGYEYGTNYLGAPVLGLFVWCIVCFALNTLLDWLYEKTGCIWVPSIAHGAFNAVAALFVVLTNPADSYYNVLGPAPIGLIGMLPMLAAAVWLTLRRS